MSDPYEQLSFPLLSVHTDFELEISHQGMIRGLLVRDWRWVGAWCLIFIVCVHFDWRVIDLRIMMFPCSLLASKALYHLDGMAWTVCEVWGREGRESVGL